MFRGKQKMFDSSTFEVKALKSSDMNPEDSIKNVGLSNWEIELSTAVLQMKNSFSSPSNH